MARSWLGLAVADVWIGTSSKYPCQRLLTIGYAISHVHAVVRALWYAATSPTPSAMSSSNSSTGAITLAEYCSFTAPVAAVTRNGHGDWSAFPARTCEASAFAAATAASR